MEEGEGGEQEAAFAVRCWSNSADDTAPQAGFCRQGTGSFYFIFYLLSLTRHLALLAPRILMCSPRALRFSQRLQ